MIKALVTGGAGFIGSHVAERLVKTGYNVIVLDDLSGGCQDNIPIGVQFIEGSITDTKLIADLFTAEKFDYVYHLAAYAAEGLSHFIRHFNYTNNLLGSVNLINQSVIHNIKCFVFTSSIAVYGAAQTPMDETITPHPEDPYGIAKYAIELDLETAARQFGLNYMVFRPHNVYGERQNIGDKYRNVVGIFMNQVLQRKALTIFGDGEQTRAFTYIDDIAPLIAGSVNYPKAYGEVFNIGSDQVYSINQLVKAVAAVMKADVEINYLAARNEVKHAFSNHNKLGQYFELPTPIDLNEGLQRMAQWVAKVGARKTKDFGNIEISRGLPAGW